MTHPSIKKFLHELKQLAKAESIPCVGGRSELPTQPGLKVKGRHISLPVNQVELDWICKQGQVSPFGKGVDTVVDSDIRRSIEFEARDVEVSNPHWETALKNLIKSISTQMGIDFQFEAGLFKLLVYREGGHFKFHQDTEKASGMFATLIIQLPSRCQGGSLVCRFADKEYEFDFGNKAADSEFSIYYAAHYADVHHQVEKIEEGARLVLVYNLIQPIKERQLSANHHKQLLDSAKEIVLPIFSLLSQEQHALLLQHEYTEQSLSDMGFLAAKGRDRGFIKALLTINEHLPLEHKLYFMISRVSYSVTSDGCGGGYYDDDIYWEEIESSEPGCDLCFDEEGQIIPADNFSIDWVHDLNEKAINSVAFNKIDEDFWGEGDDDIEGYMGNYGPTKETTYSRYLFVVMPVYPANVDSLTQDAVFQAHRVSLMAQDLGSYPNCDWLQERFDLALKDVVSQFNAIVSQKESPYHWNSGFDKAGQPIFAKLLKTAIERDDCELCNTLLMTAKERLVANLSSEYQAKNVLSLLKEVIDHFGWEILSVACLPLLNLLSGSIALQASIVLAEKNTDIKLRAQLMDVCVSKICREKNAWGGRCGFKATILPLALNLCQTGWHASNKSKDLFLVTCLEKGAEQPSFLSVLSKHLIADIQADNKEWLLPTLITTRLKHLRDELRREPEEFAWFMPNASARNSTIAEFLRSESQEAKITGYDGIAMARNDVVNLEPKLILPEFYMEFNADFLQLEGNHGFSASMQALGRGKKAYIEIKKDKRYYELSLKLRELRKKEFKKLEKMIDLESIR